MLKKNLSERYESRFVSVRVEESVAVMLQGMGGSVLGVWVAHGEGWWGGGGRTINYINII